MAVGEYGDLDEDSLEESQIPLPLLFENSISSQQVRSLRAWARVWCGVYFGVNIIKYATTSFIFLNITNNTNKWHRKSMTLLRALQAR